MYGSFINHLYSHTSTPDPVVGMGVTELLWSDRYPWEVVEVKDSKHITVRRLDAVRKDGTDYYDQEYDLFSNENNTVIKLYKTPTGWRERIGKNGLGSIKYFVGHAERYEDPSF